VAGVITDFIAKNRQFLRPGRAADPGHKQPSQRSWKRLSDTLISSGLVDRPKDPVFYSVCLGYVGLEATVAFQDFAVSTERLTPEQIFNAKNYSNDVFNKVAALPQERFIALLEGVGAWLNDADIEYQKNPTFETVTKDDGTTEQVKVPWTITDAQGQNLQDFLYQTTNEMRIKFWTLVAARGMEAIDMIKTVHPWIVQPILDVFGVTAGEKGTTQIPIIPGFLDPNATDKEAGKDVVSGPKNRTSRGTSTVGRQKKSKAEKKSA
jgi:hypothetical protein